MSEKEMTLEHALRILADCHTRDDALSGFVVEMSPHMHWHSQHDYIQAWAELRKHIGLQVDPPTKEPTNVR